MFQEKLEALKARLEVVADLSSAAMVLGWDQATYMPPGGAEARGRQLATLSRLAHEALTDAGVGHLLDELEPLCRDLHPDSDEVRLVEVTRHDYEQAAKVPSSFLAEFERHSSRGYQLWTEARPADDFDMVADHLERTVELSRQYSGFFTGFEHIADPLIDASDRGMTVAALRPLFAELRELLVPFVDTITAQEPPDLSPLLRHYPEEEQIAFGERVIRAFGYDFERGRQDMTRHPFATSFSVGDVRITTRVKRNDLSEALFSTLHEAGHAMYEQGVDPAYEGTPLARGTSSGVHESQSRLWENVVGRSWVFWSHWYPLLRQAFPEQLGEVPLEDFYRAVNRVSRSLIRTDADEVTYNLHVMVRFELELELLEGVLAVRDLPEAWRDRYQRYLGASSDGDGDGVLQDVHWFAGAVGGAFQGYTIGNVLSAQFFEAALEACPAINDEMAVGRFDSLHSWLRQNVYRHGRKFSPAELVQRATGSELGVEPYFRYLRAKYGEIYRLG